MTELQQYVEDELKPYLMARAKARRARADHLDPATAVLRLDDDADPVSKAVRQATERIALQGVRTDEQRTEALERLDRATEQREWLDAFANARQAREVAEAPAVDVEAARLAAERRINQAWRPRS